MYSAVLLDEKSQEKLKAWALSDKADIRVNHIRLPIQIRDNGWKLICHHMTIKFSGTPEFVKPYIDSKQSLEAIAVGISDNAVAVRVIGFPSENKIPHITIAIPLNGKAKDSNEIIEWKRLPTPIKLNGVVKEIE